MKYRNTLLCICVKWLSQEGNYERWLYCDRDSPRIATEINEEHEKEFKTREFIDTDNIMYHLQHLEVTFIDDCITIHKDNHCGNYDSFMKHDSYLQYPSLCKNMLSLTNSSSNEWSPILRTRMKIDQSDIRYYNFMIKKELKIKERLKN